MFIQQDLCSVSEEMHSGQSKMASSSGLQSDEISPKLSSTDKLNQNSNNESFSETLEIPLDRVRYMCAHHGPKIVSFTDTESSATAETSCTSPLLVAENTYSPSLRKKEPGDDSCLQRELSSMSSESSASFNRLNESSGIMCRICHCGEEEEKLMITCKCMGTVKYAHQNCVLNWISKSGNQYCELCKYKFKTRRKKVKSLWKVSVLLIFVYFSFSFNVFQFLILHYE